MAAPMKSSTSPAPIFGSECAQAEAVPWTGSGELQLRQMSEEPIVIALPNQLGAEFGLRLPEPLAPGEPGFPNGNSAQCWAVVAAQSTPTMLARSLMT